MTIENLERVLREHPFFTGMDPAHLQTLVGCSSNVTFDEGIHLFREGEAADNFYLIRLGRVTLECFAPTRGPLAIETAEAGDVLGWSWLFPPYRWHFDARARTFVQALSLDGACLRRKCENDPALGYDLLKRFAGVAVQRLEATQLQLLDLYAGAL
jgi:CRP-like cAMP-binding protein